MFVFIFVTTLMVSSFTEGKQQPSKENQTIDSLGK